MEIKLNRVQTWLLRQTVKGKLKEFHRAGYLNVVEPEIWDYTRERLWKKQQPTSLADYKKDVKSITINAFFDYQQLKVQVQDVTNFDFGSIQDLL